MSISRQNLSVVIVSFYSHNVIDDCIKSIPKDIKIIVVENSGDKYFKEKIEKTYKNVECILLSQNIGMGPGNNVGLRHTKTDYSLILNPDVILEKNTIDELINAAVLLDSFGIIAPVIKSNKNLNFKLFKNKIAKRNFEDPFKVKSVDGFAMLINVKKLSRNKNFNNFNFFDENFFLYLENDDLCKRVLEINEDIYIIPKSKIYHIGAGAVDSSFKREVELSRNWHWIWSKFYYNKKHYGYLNAFIRGFPTFFKAIIKYLFYSILNNKKKDIYLSRCLGFLNGI